MMRIINYIFQVERDGDRIRVRPFRRPMYGAFIYVVAIHAAELIGRWI